MLPIITVHRAVVAELLLLLALSHATLTSAQCYIDPYTGRQICMPPAADSQPSSRVRPAAPSQPQPSAPSLGAASHCRITVGDGTTGSGTLIEVNSKSALVLTCAHLFDTSNQQIVVAFPNGERFAARLLDRDRAHDLAALAIRPPHCEPIPVHDYEPTGELRACGFGPDNSFRCVQGRLVGRATAAGAVYPSLTMSGAVRPGDSGGAVLNTAGKLVGVVWGQRDGCTYATCGQPLREFLSRVRYRQSPTRPESPNPTAPARAIQPDFAAWSRDIESRIAALDAKKQDKGHYLKATDLRDYVRVEALPRLVSKQFADRSEIENRFKSVSSRFESIQSNIESLGRRADEAATGKESFFHGLSLGKLVAGALGLSGPLAVAVIVAGGLAGKRVRSKAHRLARSQLSEVPDSHTVVVDSPIPPQRTVPETHYVPIEKDSFAKAHQWASEHVARKYPGAAEILQAQDSLIKQHMSAH